MMSTPPFRTKTHGALPVIAATALAALAACAPRTVPPGLGVPWGATVKSIVANPQQADGKLVTVSGEVNRIFGPRWFSIGGEGYDGGEELLVVGSSRLPALLDNLADSGHVANDLVQVTGRVRFFDAAALEKELGADLGNDWWRPYERKPVVVMTDLDITPRIDVVPVAAVPVPVPVPMPVVPITDETAIVDARDAAALAGRPVALFNVTVQTVVGPNTFWVGPSAGRQLFVALEPAPAVAVDVRPGQSIALAGVLRALPEDLTAMRSAWSLTAANEATLAGERVYLSATGIRVTTRK